MIWNLIIVFGLSSVGWGLWQVYPPLVWISGGLLLTVIGVRGPDVSASTTSSASPTAGERDRND